MRFEIDNHRDKLLRISKLTPEQLDEACHQLYKRITFINENFIEEKTWLQAEQLVADFDLDDTDFVALAKHTRGYLWTGDKALYSGLKAHGFKRVYTTSELLAVRELRTKN